jgi:hypothetical protein
MICKGQFVEDMPLQAFRTIAQTIAHSLIQGLNTRLISSV